MPKSVEYPIKKCAAHAETLATKLQHEHDKQPSFMWCWTVGYMLEQRNSTNLLIHILHINQIFGSYFSDGEMQSRKLENRIDLI